MTTPSAPDPQLEIHAPTATTKQDHLVLRVLRNPLGLAAIAFLTLAILAAIFAPLLAPYDPNLADIRAVLDPPSAAHPLGTDGAGRDVLSRLLYGAQFSLAGAALALVVAMVLGVIGGLLAGYFGGVIDMVSAWAVALLMALPGIIVLLAARAVIGPSLWWSMVIFGVLLSPSFFRLVYASVTAVRHELYVDAARVSGLSDGRIISRHILTVVRAPIVIQAAIVGGIGLAIQSGLEFLGLGDLRVPTWGAMLSDAFVNLYRSPSLIIWPASMIALTLISLTLLANTIRDELERAGGRKASRRRRAAAAKKAAAPIRETVIHHDSRDADITDALLKISNLSVGYGQPDGSIKRVVEDVTLTVARGEVHGLVGESGSGKTQTAWSVLGLLPEGGRVVGGSIVFDGTDLAAANERQRQDIRGRRIAYIPQEPMSNLDPSYTIGSQLVEPMRLKLGLSQTDAKARALELLAKVGIPQPERTYASYPHQVSGGMAQRVLIAGAISCKPDLLIADEPTTALDVTVQADVLDVLRDLQAELHMGVVLVTHNFGVVADICDRVSVMRAGRIVESGSTRDIFTNPQHPYTRELLGSILHNTEPRGPLEPAGATSGGAASTAQEAVS
jgi:peptide/nickel transport system permease protein